MITFKTKYVHFACHKLCALRVPYMQVIFFYSVRKFYSARKNMFSILVSSQGVYNTSGIFFFCDANAAHRSIRHVLGRATGPDNQCTSCMHARALWIVHDCMEMSCMMTSVDQSIYRILLSSLVLNIIVWET